MGKGEEIGPAKAKATFGQEGNAIDYTPGADVGAGDIVVQNDLVGIAKRDIKANVLGALAITGVFDFPKATGASTAIGAGVKLYFDSAAQVATATVGTNKQIGKTVAAAADADATVRGYLSQ